MTWPVAKLAASVHITINLQFVYSYYSTTSTLLVYYYLYYDDDDFYYRTTSQGLDSTPPRARSCRLTASVCPPRARPPPPRTSGASSTGTRAPTWCVPILSLVCVLGTWLAAGTAALEAAESIQGAAAAAATNQSSRASQTNQRLCISHMRQAPVLMVVGVQKGGTSFLGAVFKTLFCGPVAGEPHFWSDMCLAVASVGPSTRDRYLERYSRSLPPCTRSHGCLFAWSRHLGHPPSCQRLSCCFEILLREQWSGFLQCAYYLLQTTCLDTISPRKRRTRVLSRTGGKRATNFAIGAANRMSPKETQATS